MRHLESAVRTHEATSDLTEDSFDFQGSGKHASVSIAKELFALAGCEMGASLKQLAEIAGMSSAAMSRRRDAGRARIRDHEEMARLVARTVKECRQR